MTFHYRCSRCGRIYAPDEVTYTCPADDGNLDILLDYDALKQVLTPSFPDLIGNVPSLWRYLPLLPVPDPDFVTTPLAAAGWTPVFAPPALRRATGLAHLWLKDESRNPTASLKDRASAVVVARALALGVDTVITASTGNAGAALAGMAAAVGLRAVILAPKSAPQAKIAQLLIYGAQVALVDGTYDDAFDLSIEAAETLGWYCRNTGFNPFTVEGKKTVAYEIWEQVLLPQRLERPLHIFVPVGDGNIISGVYKGFWDLQQLGWLDQMPRLYGVQAAGSAAIARAWEAGAAEVTPVHAQTIADSISVDLPRDGRRALRAVRQTKGAYLTVSDEAILAAMAELGRVGLFAEPAAAAAWAGLREALRRGWLTPEDPALVLLTGSGLKDVHAAMQAVPSAPVVPAGNLRALRRALGEHGG